MCSRKMFNLFTQITQTIFHKWVRTSLLAFVLFVCSGAAWAQSSNAEPALGSKDSTAQSDSAIWKGELVNDEYQVFIRMNLYAQDISVPGQEIYGELPGYFGSKRSPLPHLSRARRKPLSTLSTTMVPKTCSARSSTTKRNRPICFTKRKAQR